MTPASSTTLSRRNNPTNPPDKKRTNPKVPDTPEGVLEFVRNKLRGLLPGESVPLSVGGHVDELILQATSDRNLAAMYIGWCAFF